MMSVPLGKIWPLVLVLVLCDPGPAGAQNKANVTFLGALAMKGSLGMRNSEAN